MKKIIVSLSIALVATVALMAQTMSNVPDFMHYQTVIRNANGDLLVEKPIGVKITIFEKEDPTAGAMDVYVETHAVTTDANGVAAIQIGSGTVAPGQHPVLGSIWWAGHRAKWMRVEIDPTGGTNYSLISGESQLLTVPYAFHSNTAVNADFAMRASEAQTAKTAQSVTGPVTVSQIGDLPLADVIVVIEELGTQAKDNIKVEMIGKTFTIANATTTQTPMKLLAYTPTYMWIKNNKGKIGGNVHISVTLNGVDLNSEALNYNPVITSMSLSRYQPDDPTEFSYELFNYNLYNYTTKTYNENSFTPVPVEYSSGQASNYQSRAESKCMIGPFLPNPAGGKNIIKISVYQIVN